MRLPPAGWLAYTAIGLVTGFASGLLGIGGGVIMVPAIHLLFHKSMQVAVGTSLAVIVVGSVAATVRHAGLGNVDWHIALGLGVGSIIGAYFLGPPLAEVLSSDMLRRIFGVVMCLFGLRMIGVFQWLAHILVK